MIRVERETGAGFDDGRVRLFVGNAEDVLASLPSESVHCCVTSPPYWGLRDYGTEGQIGLEATPEEYVARLVEVFREVRRVLREDGTLWLNLGDSYVSVPSGGFQGSNGQMAGRRIAQVRDAKAKAGMGAPERPPSVEGLAPKNLVGIPWRVAFALQQPYYAGTIKNREDRIWLAAMLDAEGCMFIQKRKAGQHNGQGYHRKNDNYGPGVEIANTSLAVVERIAALVGKGSICSQGPEQNGRRRQTIYRWNLRTTECREFVRELYPHLVAKQQQARILCGCPSSGPEAEAAHAALKALHRGEPTDTDFPAPPTLLEPGYWLRSDVIWSKANPMPESVRDRPTKAHEYVFLLSKSKRYYYDAAAIAEQSVTDDPRRPYGSPGANALDGRESPQGNGANRKRGEFNGKTNALPGREAFRAFTETRNRRSVWTITTKPYAEAHFATFPPDLPELCIKAGTPPDGVVLDPFAGAGTTLWVAKELGRQAVGIELNPEYARLIEKRCAQGVLALAAPHASAGPGSGGAE